MKSSYSKIPARTTTETVTGGDSKNKLHTLASDQASLSKGAFSVSKKQPPKTQTKVIVKEFQYKKRNWYQEYNDVVGKLDELKSPEFLSPRAPTVYTTPITDGEADLSEGRTPSAEREPTEEELAKLAKEEDTTPVSLGVALEDSLTSRQNTDSKPIRTKSKWLKIGALDPELIYQHAETDQRYYNARVEVAGDHLWLKIYDKLLDRGGFLAGCLRGSRGKVELQYDANGETIVNENGVAVCGCSRCVKGNKNGPRSAEKKRRDNVFRAKERLVKIITANYPKLTRAELSPAMITLTYAGKYRPFATAKHYASCLRDLQLYLRVLRSIGKSHGLKLRYVWAPELQKDGTVHFHILCFNLPWLTKEEMTLIKESWPKGFDEKSKWGGENIKRWPPGKHGERKGMFYVAKYIGKAGEWVPPELNLYGLSSGLNLPVLIKDCQREFVANFIKPRHVIWGEPVARYMGKHMACSAVRYKIEPALSVPSTAKPSQGRLTETFTT